MTLTTTTTHSVPVAPTRGAPASARPRRGDDHRRVLGAGARSVNGRATIAHIGGWLEREGWLGNFDLAASGAPARGPSRARVLGLGGLQVPRGDRLGDRSPQRPPACRRTSSRRGSARWSRGSRRRRSPTATSTRGSGGRARARAGPTSSGGTSCTASDTSSRRPSPACARVPMPTTDSSTSPVAPPTSCARSSARAASSASAATPRSRSGLAELGRALGEPRYLEQARLFVERHGRGTLRDIEWGRSYYQDDQRRARRRRAARPRGAGELPRRGRRRRRDRDRRRRAAARPRPPVGHHRRAPHVRDRRAGFAPPGRGVRRGLGAAVGSRVLRDLCGRGIRDVQLAAAARPGRRALRRPHRAHAVQRDRDVAVAPTAPRSTTRTRCTSGVRAPWPTPTRCRRGRSRRCARPGSTCRAARRTPPARSRASPRTSRRRMPRASSCTSTPPRRSARRSTADRRSPSRSRPSTRGRARCGSGC